MDVYAFFMREIFIERFYPMTSNIYRAMYSGRGKPAARLAGLKNVCVKASLVHTLFPPLKLTWCLDEKAGWLACRDPGCLSHSSFKLECPVTQKLRNSNMLQHATKKALSNEKFLNR